MVNVEFRNARTFKPTLDGLKVEATPHTRSMSQEGLTAMRDILSQSGLDARNFEHKVKQATAHEAAAEMTAQNPSGPAATPSLTPFKPGR
jgi:hypothetical protein